MIDFTCSACGRLYLIPDINAGRKARCKCGESVRVPDAIAHTNGTALEHSDDDNSAVMDAVAMPAAAVAIAPPPIAPIPVPVMQPAPLLATPAIAAGAPIAIRTGSGKLPMRTRRLIADAEAMHKAFDNFPLIRLKSTTGTPPDVYQIEFDVRGLERGKKRDPIPRETHLVEIQLTSDYPRLGPKCRMLTPVFHPNIDPATICVGDHWTAGERLADLVVRIGQMITYQDYNIKSPLDGEAAMWADLNRDKLPLDDRNLYPPQMEA